MTINFPSASLVLALDLVGKTIQEEVAFLCLEWDTELSDECCQSGFRGDSANLPRQHMEPPCAGEGSSLRISPRPLIAP